MTESSLKRRGYVVRYVPYRDSAAMVRFLSEEGFCSFSVRGASKPTSKAHFLSFVLSEDEIDDLDEDQRNEQLAIYWCAKEAVYKKMSQYNVDFAEQIEIEDFRMRGEGELEATFTQKDGFEEEIHLQYMTFDRHVLVWVAG